jgi:hypothetical protein
MLGLPYLPIRFWHPNPMTYRLKKSKYSRSQSRLCTRNWLDCSCVSRWPNHVHSFCFWIWIHQWQTSAVLKGLFPFTPAPSSLSDHPSPPLPSPPLPSSLFLTSRLSRSFRNSGVLRALLPRNSIPSSAGCYRHLIPMSSPSQGSFTSLCGFVSSSPSLALSIRVTFA